MDTKGLNWNMTIMYVLSDDIGRNTSANIRNAGLINGFLNIGVSVQVVCLKEISNKDHGLLQMISGSDLLYLTHRTQREKRKEGQNSCKSKLKTILVRFYNIFRIYDPNIHLIRRMAIDIKSLKQPDIILSSSDPRSAHVLARKIAKALDFHGALIQYWGDPICNDISASRLMRPFLKIIERELLLTANLSLYTNHASCDKICKLYNIPSKKMMALPTPYEPSYTTSKQPDDKRIRVGYFGEYYSWRRNMNPLFDYIRGNKEYRLTIAGKTDLSIDESLFDVYPVLPSDEVSKLVEQMDILVVVENLPKKGHETDCIQIPGKVYHYGATDKKILVINETGLTYNEFHMYNRYKFCENNVESIGNALAELVKDESEKMHRPVIDFYPTNVAKKVLSWYEHEYQE